MNAVAASPVESKLRRVIVREANVMDWSVFLGRVLN